MTKEWGAQPLETIQSSTLFYNWERKQEQSGSCLTQVQPACKQWTKARIWGFNFWLMLLCSRTVLLPSPFPYVHSFSHYRNKGALIQHSHTCNLSSSEKKTLLCLPIFNSPDRFFPLNSCNWKLESTKHQSPRRVTPHCFPSPDLVYMFLSAKF